MTQIWKILLVAAFILPAASAHLTVSTQSPEGVVPIGETIDIPVTVSANCGVVLAEYDSAGNDELTLAVMDPPEWVTYTGDKVSFSVTDCYVGTEVDRALNVFASGFVHVTLSPLAPGLVEQNFTVGPEGEVGGAPVIFTPGLLQLVTASYESEPIKVTSESAHVMINVTAFANGKLLLEPATSGVGTFMGLDAKELGSPENGTANYTYHAAWLPPAGEWTTLTETVTLQTVSVQNGELRSEPVNLTFTFVNEMMDCDTTHDMTSMDDHDASMDDHSMHDMEGSSCDVTPSHDDDHDHDDEKSTPGFAIPLVIGAILLARKRTL